MIPTPASLNFVGLETWSELSENRVALETFGLEDLGHVSLAREADLIVVAPATADLLARFSAGMADDLLTTTLLASQAPILLAPAMHTEMWLAPATQRNITTLLEDGVTIVGPEDGPLSSGDTGPGRMSEPEQILDASEKMMAEIFQADYVQNNAGNNAPLAGKTVLVTAGGTREELDPVRFIGNHSSGRQGIEVAHAAREAGAEVVLIAANVGEDLLEKKTDIQVIKVESTAELQTAVEEQVRMADCLVMAAAVADYRPSQPAEQKLKKEDAGETLTIELVPNPDILATVARSADRPQILVGFAAETGQVGDVLELGKAKAARKAADFLAVNRVGGGMGFGDVPNHLYFLDKQGNVVSESAGSKKEVAQSLVALISEKMLRQEEQ